MSKTPDRSAASVERVLSAIREAMARNPDWRVGQLVVNANGGDDPFYIENDALAHKMDTFDARRRDKGTR